MRQEWDWPRKGPKIDYASESRFEAEVVYTAPVRPKKQRLDTRLANAYVWFTVLLFKIAAVVFLLGVIGLCGLLVYSALTAP
jgi:hypothetical protein